MIPGMNHTWFIYTFYSVLSVYMCVEIANFSFVNGFGTTFQKSLSDISKNFSIDLGSNYLSIARFWPANKKHTAMNAFVACVLWNIWKTRNNHVFNNAVWSDLK